MFFYKKFQEAFVKTYLLTKQRKVQYNFICIIHTNCEVINMDKKQQEKWNRKKNNEKFNSITQKVKPENQNQTHNVRSEAVEPKNRQV